MKTIRAYNRYYLINNMPELHSLVDILGRECTENDIIQLDEIDFLRLLKLEIYKTATIHSLILTRVI